MEIIKPGIRIDFMRQLRFWVSLSMFLAITSLILCFMPPGASMALGPLRIGLGPNYGTDFRGGTELEVTFKKPIAVGPLRDAIASIPGFSRPDVVAEGAGDLHYLIRVQEHSALEEKTMQGLRAAVCYRGTSRDASGKEVADPELDKARCDAQPHATEVKFSPGGDMMAVRYELATEDTFIELGRDEHGAAVPQLSPAAQENMKASLRQIGVELRGTAKDFTVKGHETSQLREYRVELQLKSKGDLLLDELRRKLGDDLVPAAADKVEWVGPRAGKQLRDAAIKSVLFAIVFIMAYVAIRFDLRFAPGGILALFHDALVVLGVFIVTQREISLSTIAAILTIVGYSISDTVIIYDRIRENLNKHRGMSFRELINMSVSETLARTLLTSTSVLLSIVGLFFAGTGALRDFALALFVGVIAGTYSSIFVAAPLTDWIDHRFFGASATKGKKRKKRSKAGLGGAKQQVQHQL